MNVLPSTSSRRDPRARRMNSGDAPTALNARTGLSTPPGRIWQARENHWLDCLKRIVDPSTFEPWCPWCLADFYGGEAADGRRQEFLLVLVVRPAAGGVERARGAVEIALQQEHRGDAHRGAVRRGVALERPLE